MYISFKSPKVIAVGLIGLLASLNVETLDRWGAPPAEQTDVSIDRPELSDQTPINPVVPRQTAHWVTPKTDPEKGSLLPPHLDKNWTPVELMASQETLVRDLEYCVISMAQLSTKKSPLYVRATPRNNGAIVGELESGRWIGIINGTEQWFEIIDPTKGWVKRSEVDSACNEKVERLNLGPRHSSIPIKDRMVGVAVHRYLIHVPPGKALTLKNVEGTIPRIIDPHGELLTQDWQTTDESLPEWTGELMESGDYRLEVVSHDSQLEYSFLVEVTPLQEYAQILNR